VAPPLIVVRLYLIFSDSFKNIFSYVIKKTKLRLACSQSRYRHSPNLRTKQNSEHYRYKMLQNTLPLSLSMANLEAGSHRLTLTVTMPPLKNTTWLSIRCDVACVPPHKNATNKPQHCENVSMPPQKGQTTVSPRAQNTRGLRAISPLIL